MSNTHRLAIQVLEHKITDYNRIIFDGRYRYHDPEHEIRTYEQMRDNLKETVSLLLDLQEKN